VPPIASQIPARFYIQGFLLFVLHAQFVADAAPASYDVIMLDTYTHALEFPTVWLLLTVFDRLAFIILLLWPS
jgi:hypothetical protein